MTIKEFIAKEVTHMPEYESVGIIDLDKTIDVFLKVLDIKVVNDDIDGTGEHMKASLNKLVGSLEYEDALLILRNLNETEPYARLVLFLTAPQELKKIRDEKGGYSPILRALGFSHNQVSRMGDRRNVEGDHGLNSLSLLEVYQRINKFLLDYLRITNIKLDELSRLVSVSEEEADFPHAYILNVIKEYEAQKGFRYMDVHWHGEEGSSVDCNIDNLINDPNIWKGSTNGIKFLGEAGTGKTTALKRIQYQLALDFNNGKTGDIPVYISLSELNSDSGCVINRVVEIAQTDREHVVEMLRAGKLVLLLDGYNEILDTQTQRNVAKELDNYILLNFNKTKIYISDRTIAKSSLPVMTSALKLYLRELTIDEKMDYFRERVPEEVYSLIKQKRECDEGYFNLINTPLKLECFAEVVEGKKTIPDDITESYLDMLFDREKNENKELGMDAIEDLLCALAIYIYRAEGNKADIEDDDEFEENDDIPSVPSISRTETKMILAKVKNALGYYEENEHFERVTKGMKILNWENDSVGFSSREYLMHFMLKGTASHIDKTIE